jgi:hypothetical protein
MNKKQRSQLITAPDNLIDREEKVGWMVGSKGRRIK